MECGATAAPNASEEALARHSSAGWNPVLSICAEELDPSFRWDDGEKLDPRPSLKDGEELDPSLR